MCCMQAKVGEKNGGGEGGREGWKAAFSMLGSRRLTLCPSLLSTLPSLHYRTDASLRRLHPRSDVGHLSFWQEMYSTLFFSCSSSSLLSSFPSSLLFPFSRHREGLLEARVRELERTVAAMRMEDGGRNGRREKG